MFRFLSGLAVAAALSSAQPAFAAYYPLEITAPRANMPAAHRMLRAYPGLVYNIRAAVVGGAYPYTYSLSNAPEGMTINSQTGEINWPNPTSSASSVRLTIRDSENTQVSQTWSIAVSTTGFRFVDAVNGTSTGSGTISSPWRTLADVYNRGAGSDIVYFRSGTYTTGGIPTTNSGLELRVEFDNANGRPVQWLAYPGASPVIDHGYSGSPTPRIRMTGDTVYVDGFEVRNIYVMGFQVSHRNQGSMFRRNNMHRLMVGGDGSNAAFIMTTSNYGNRAYGMVVQDNTFHHILAPSDTATTLKFYSINKLLVENNIHHDVSGAANELKADLGQFTVRGDTYYNMSMNAIGGNQANDPNNPANWSTGEICFNNVRDGGTIGALRLNLNSEAGAIYAYRNTLQGRVIVHNTDGGDGPFTLVGNVIVNNDNGTPAGSHIYHSNVSSPSRIVLLNNLVGFPSNNIVDSQGSLMSAYSNYLGTHGHLITAISGPRSPTNLRIIP